MEETNITTPDSKPTYEQLNNIAVFYQNKTIQLEAKLNAINLTTLRLDCLFKILNNPNNFPEEFVNKCTEEIMSIMDVKEVTE